MSLQMPPIDVTLLVRSLHDEIGRLNRVLDEVPLDVRLAAEERAAHVCACRCHPTAASAEPATA